MIWIAVIWIISGIFAYAGCLAYFEREFPAMTHMQKKETLCFAFLLGAFGVLGLVVTLLKSGLFKHGLLFWPEKRG